MIERKQYNESFRQQALQKVYTRGSGTVKVVAEDLNMSYGTLKNWMKADKNSSQAKAGVVSHFISPVISQFIPKDRAVDFPV